VDFVATRTEGKVLVVELRRADKGNALNRQLQRELTEVWQELDDNDGLLIGIVHGGPEVFSIGHDVEELLRGEGAAASPIPEDGMFPVNISKPVIAAVEGPCYGLGLELALSCDLRVAGEGALFGFPDANLQVSYRVASVLLPRMIFLGLAEEMIFSGKVLDAQQAHEARLVNQLASRGQALTSALEAAGSMSQRFGSAEAFRKGSILRLSGIALPAAQELARAT
jgi:enoyl-CoA hydratase